MPPKPDLVFNSAPTVVETEDLAFNVQLNPTKSEQDLSHITRPSAPIIEDWVSDSKEESETKVTQFVPSLAQSSKYVKSPRPVSAALPNITVTRPRHAHQVVTKFKSPIRRHITHSPSSRTSDSPLRVTAVQAPMVSVVQGKQGTWLKFNLFSVSQMCDKKNSVLFTDTECLVLSSDFKLPDESQVLLRVLRENDMYNVNLKNIVPSGDLTCLFAKETINKSNLWHRRLAHINFKTFNKLVKGNLVRGLPTKVFENDHTCVACKKVRVGNQTNSGAGFQDNFDAEKAGEKVDQSYMLFLVCAQSKEQDDKTKKKAKGKSHVESVTGYRDLNAEFQDCSTNSSNEVNAASYTVPTVGQNSLNITNTFSAAGPSNDVVSPTYKKTSDIDASQLPDDPDMPELEDIIYSDD
nr:ribonuclease H-like domain-containing protein [Tanacetum cinerariifolium]